MAPVPEEAAPGVPPLDARSTPKAVWALAMLGGPVLFQAEMDAALAVRPCAAPGESQGMG